MILSIDGYKQRKNRCCDTIKGLLHFLLLILPGRVDEYISRTWDPVEETSSTCQLAIGAWYLPTPPMSSIESKQGSLSKAKPPNSSDDLVLR